MSSVVEALEKIEAAALGNERLAELLKQDTKELREVLVLSLSPQITFGMKKLPEPVAVPEASPLDDEDWLNLLRRLTKGLRFRDYTGNDAKTRVAEFLGMCTESQRKWAERIIRQDLRINLGAKDVNNVLGEDTVFQFTVPLAKPTMDPDGGWAVTEKDLKGKWCIEPKLDGARCVAYLPADKGKVQLFSRSGKEWLNFEPVREMLQKVNDTRGNSLKTIVLDGEVVSLVDDKINFQALQSVLFRKDGKQTGRLKYMIFDATFQEDWESPKKNYIDRWNFAKDFVQNSLKDVPAVLVRLGFVEMFQATDPTTAQLQKWNLEFSAKGYEGAMARRADLPVAMKRSKTLLKIKTFVEEEGQLIGAKEGEGKRRGTVGALVCKRPQTGVEYEVGSGFTDEEAKEYWEQFKAGKLSGLVTVKYQPPLTDDGKPRFPIFKGIRHPDDAEAAA